MTQEQQVLEYLQSHPEGITSMDAIMKFGITRLAAVIFLIKENSLPKGMEINTYMETKNKKTFGRYKLEKIKGTNPILNLFR